MHKLWARAGVATLVFLAFWFGLLLLGMDLVEGSGDHPLKMPILLVLGISLFVGLIIGPAWVFQPRTTPPDGGPPRGRILAMPLRTPHDPATSAEPDDSSAAARAPLSFPLPGLRIARGPSSS